MYSDTISSQNKAEQGWLALNKQNEESRRLMATRNKETRGIWSLGITLLHTSSFSTKLVPKLLQSKSHQFQHVLGRVVLKIHFLKGVGDMAETTEPAACWVISDRNLIDVTQGAEEFQCRQSTQNISKNLLLEPSRCFPWLPRCAMPPPPYNHLDPCRKPVLQSCSQLDRE